MKQSLDMANRPGRPSKLTTEVIRTLALCIRLGVSSKNACVQADIDYSTFFRWMERGKKARSGIYRDLWHAVHKALADAELEARNTISRAGTTSWRAAAHIVEQRFHGPSLEQQLDQGEAQLPSSTRVLGGINLFDRGALIRAIVSDVDIPEVAHLQQAFRRGELNIPGVPSNFARLDPDC